MSLFESASLVVTPNGTKASKLYAIKPTSGAGDLSVTRATTATRVNSAGLIESVASNVPRLDYTNGSCPSILVEPQRTNLLLNSETVATQTINVTAVAHTISFYGTGTITLTGTHTATVVGLGTARKTYTFTPTAGNLIITVSGTCTKGQLEAGSYATSYIPTTSASVTRNADVISKTGISSLIGQTEGTVYLECEADITNSNGAILVYLGSSDGSGAFDYSTYLKFSSNNLNLTVYSGGVLYVNSNSTVTYTNKQKIKVAFCYKNNDFICYANGIQLFTDTSGTVSTNLSSIALGHYPPNIPFNQYNGSFKNINVWKTRLTNAELSELTTI